jgi:nicotinic acid mononucleotide adenylyltransferase
LDKAGVDARVGDGNCADADGLMMILHAAGVETELPGYCYSKIVDASDDARKALLARPFFTRDGRRLAELTDKSPVLYPGSFNPAHDGHFHCGDEYTVFQITTNAPHKPPLSLSDMLDRLHWLHGKRDVLFLDQGATYLEKARLFPGCTIIMGTDSLRTLLDPKWGHEIQPMLEEMSNLYVGFLVNPRGEDNVEEILQGVPKEYRYMFSSMPPSPYQDLSSTQIRESRNRGV